MKKSIIVLGAALFLAACANMQEKGGYLDPELSFEERAIDLASQLTLEEKVAQMMAQTPAIERLGLPAYNYQGEALHGLAEEAGRLLHATSFPQSIAMGSTWNPELMSRVSTAISDEARAFYNKGELHLSFWSPNINMLRDPRWGRNDEAYSEDPYLMSRISVAFIKGLQGDHPRYFKSIAAPKHFVANNSEFNRHNGSSNIAERWLREYYFPAYKASVQEGGAFSTMCAYNRLNEIPACANQWLLTTVLRGEWGFNGYVVSDCGAIMDMYENHKYVESGPQASALAVKAGCELNCGGEYNPGLLKAVKEGLITEEEITTAVERLFLARFKLGLFAPENDVPYDSISADVIESEKHQQLALEAARESIILLKNDHILPLSEDIQSIAVIGPNANKCQLGSYSGAPSRKISVLQGIKEIVGGRIEVYYEKGCNITFKEEINFSPEEWGATTEEEIYATALEELEFKMLYEDYQDEIKETDEVLMERAVAAAKKVDRVILVMGTNRFVSNEEADAENLNWPGKQGELIKSVYEANPNVVLVLINGFQILLNWENQNIPAIVEAWYAGQEQGHAIADVLFGDYNPGGKLPVTYYKSEDSLPPIDDYDITKGRTYWFCDKEVLWPFGYGLSYTSFEMDNLHLERTRIDKKDTNINVSVDIQNTGHVEGDEVVQLYVRNVESKQVQAMKKLREFKRITLKPGEKRSVTFTLDMDDFVFWSEEMEDWYLEAGEFEIQVGNSSSNICCSGVLSIE